MIVIANSQKYRTGVIINSNGTMNDGKFELVILKSLDLLLIGKIITGNMPIDSDDIVIISTDKAQIKTDYPVNFQIDGNIAEHKRLWIFIFLHKQMRDSSSLIIVRNLFKRISLSCHSVFGFQVIEQFCYVVVNKSIAVCY